MAKILVEGAMAKVEITFDDENEGVIATCIEHSASDGRLATAGDCSWRMEFPTTDDALRGPQVERHADRG